MMSTDRVVSCAWRQTTSAVCMMSTDGARAVAVSSEGRW